MANDTAANLVHQLEAAKQSVQSLAEQFGDDAAQWSGILSRVEALAFEIRKRCEERPAARPLGLRIERDESGDAMSAAYFKVRKGEVAMTEELESGLVFADYDEFGDLLSIELLGPCPVIISS